jgi:hypothetical protein
MQHCKLNTVGIFCPVSGNSASFSMKDMESMLLYNYLSSAGSGASRECSKRQQEKSNCATTHPTCSAE